jgi:hypothetical protein
MVSQLREKAIAVSLPLSQNTGLWGTYECNPATGKRAGSSGFLIGQRGYNDSIDYSLCLGWFVKLVHEFGS